MSSADLVRKKICCENWIEDLNNRAAMFKDNENIITHIEHLRGRIRAELHLIKKELGIDETDYC